MRLSRAFVLLAVLGCCRPSQVWGQALVATSTPALGDLASQLQRLREELATTRAQLEELDAIQVDLMDASADAQLGSGPSVRLYGFYEAGVQRAWTKSRGFLSGAVNTRGTSFLLGDLHLYLDVAPSPNWRGLVEARITVANGGVDLSGATGSNALYTAVLPANRPQIGPGGPVIGMTLTLERAFIEHIFRDELGVRIGLWLTPWGIWNVDHGSPTLIPLIEPYFQSYQGFPTHQTGLALFGKAHFLPWTLEYHFGLSNGRIAGPLSFVNPTWPSFDLSDNKMLSGRVSVRRLGGTDLRFGLSSYWGRTANGNRNIVSTEPLAFESEINIELEEWGLGADAAYDGEQVRLRFEFSYTQYRFLGRRPNSTWFPLELASDSAQYSGYGLISTPFQGLGIVLEPYLFCEWLWWPAVLAPRDAAVTPSLGVNFDFTTQVRLKFQYTWVLFFRADQSVFDLEYSAQDDVHAGAVRLVVSF